MEPKVGYLTTCKAMSNLSDTKRFDPVVWAGPWVAGLYPANSMVSYLGLAYIAKVNTSLVPTDPVGWDIAYTSPGGLLHFQESLSIPAPLVLDINGNYVSGIDDKPSCVLEAQGAHTNLHMVLKVKGQGGILVSSPDGTAAGGGYRGLNCIDLQMKREASTEVASGPQAMILGGEANTSSGVNSICIGGYKNVSSASNSTCFGERNIASGNNSFVIGKGATDRGVRNSFVQGVAAIDSTENGKYQTARRLLSSAHNGLGNVPVFMTVGGDAVNATNVIHLPIGLTHISGEVIHVSFTTIVPVASLYKRWVFTALVNRKTAAAIDAELLDLAFKYPDTTGTVGLTPTGVCLRVDLDPVTSALRLTAQTDTGTRFIAKIETLELTQ